MQPFPHFSQISSESSSESNGVYLLDIIYVDLHEGCFYFLGFSFSGIWNL